MARGLYSAGSVVVVHGLSCSAACRIFPDQGSNPCPLHWQADSWPLCHQGSPRYTFSIVYYLGVELLCCKIVNECLRVMETAQLFQTCTILHPHQERMRVLVLHTLGNTGYCQSFKFWSFWWVSSGISLWLEFALPLELEIMNIFSCAHWPFVYLLWNVCANLFPFLNCFGVFLVVIFGLSCPCFLRLGVWSVCISFASWCVFKYVR